MIDLECMVKSLRLAWLRQIFNVINGAWKSFLQHLLSPLGGFFFLACNYNISDYTISSQLYYEFLSWWSDFCQTFATEKDWTSIIWNNCEIRIDNKPIHYKNFYEAGIVYTQDLLFNLNDTDSYNHLLNKINITNILQLAGLRQSIPSSLRDKDRLPSISPPMFMIDDTTTTSQLYLLIFNYKLG